MNTKFKIELLKIMKSSFSAFLFSCSFILGACTNMEYSGNMHSNDNLLVVQELDRHLSDKCSCQGLLLSLKKHTTGFITALSKARSYSSNNPSITRLDLFVEKSRFAIVTRGDGVSGALGWSKVDDLVKPYIGNGAEISKQWENIAYSVYKNQHYDLSKETLSIHAGDNNIPKCIGNPTIL